MAGWVRFRHRTGKWHITVRLSHPFYKIYESSDYWIEF